MHLSGNGFRTGSLKGGVLLKVVSDAHHFPCLHTAPYQIPITEQLETHHCVPLKGMQMKVHVAKGSTTEITTGPSTHLISINHTCMRWCLLYARDFVNEAWTSLVGVTSV